MSGFGSDSRFLPGEADSGFGAPQAVGSFDTGAAPGFGSPTPFWVPWGLSVLQGADRYPDDGGVVVRLYGAWASRGPWVVRLTSDGGTTMYPQDAVGCYSSDVGKGHLCYADRNLRVLNFALPALPEGTYSIWIDALAVGLFGAQRVEDAIDVVKRGQCDETYRARRTWPGQYATGPRDFHLEDETLPAIPLPPLRALTRAFGEGVRDISGTAQTRLVEDFAVDDTTALVETLLGFPSSGTVSIGPLKCTYNTVTVPPAAPALLNVSVIESDVSTLSVPVLTSVSLSGGANRVREALNDTLLAEAGPSALDGLGRLYGLPRPPPVGTEPWRAALRTAAFGPRDVPGTLFSVMVSVFKDWIDQTATSVDLGTAAPQVLKGGGPWTCTHLHRLVEVAGHGIFWSTSTDGTDLTLARIGTAYWKGADWSEDETSVTVRILPFWLREEGGLYTVYIDGEISSVPPTYLLENDAERPAGQPVGGALLEDATVSTDLAGPIYLPGSTPFPTITRALNRLTAAGFHVVLTSLEWCDDETAGFGSLTDVSRFGRVLPPSGATLAALTDWLP